MKTTKNENMTGIYKAIKELSKGLKFLVVDEELTRKTNKICLKEV